jgi:uncharacterized protein YciI
MWIVELAFGDNPDRLAARPAHRELLASQHSAGVVRMAGPFTDDSGALLVLDLPDRKAVDDFLAEDPYYTTPGVIIREIHEWTPVVGV